MSVKFCLVYTQFKLSWEGLKNQTDRAREMKKYYTESRGEEYRTNDKKKKG